MKFRWRTNVGWIHSFRQAENRSFIQPKSEIVHCIDGETGETTNVRPEDSIQLQMVNQHTLFHQPEFTWLTSNQAKMCRFFSNQRPTQRHDVPTCSRRPLLICLLTGFFATSPLGWFFHIGKMCFIVKMKKTFPVVYSATVHPAILVVRAPLKSQKGKLLAEFHWTQSHL